MTVEELIRELKELPPDKPIHFQYNYGDYWRTIVAPEIQRVEEGVVTYSTYHNMPKVVDEEEKPEKGKSLVEVVLVS
jgi:hypothetical protein